MKSNTPLVLIAAVSENGVIGADGSIPWDYPRDMKHFKNTTTGAVVVMGRGTWESLPGELPSRENIVLSTQSRDSLSLPDTVHLANTPEEAIEIADDVAPDEPTYIMGGESVYSTYLDSADVLLLTHIKETVDGDTYFPDWNRDAWESVATHIETDDLKIVRYQRVDA